MDPQSMEDVDDAWYWQLVEGRENLPLLCLPRNRFG